MRRSRFGWLVFLVLMVGACAPSFAQAAYRPYSIRVEDAHGRALRSFYHEGELFVLGHYGQRYVLRVINHTDRRVEAVVSVDGRDVVSGRKGDYRSQRGYLIDPHDSIVIDGFRKSLHGVAAFRFTDPADSYSSRMGTPENVGVIGAAFFPERRRVRRRHRSHALREHSVRGRVQPSAPSSDHASSGAGNASRSAPAAEGKRSAGAAEAEASDSNIGTQYGEHRQSHAREVRFVRAHPTRPDRVLTLRYDDEPGLVARGIQVHPHRPRRHTPPEAFPLSRFAPPPPPR